MQQLVDVIGRPSDASWAKDAEAAFASLFGGGGGRYPQSALNTLSIRAPGMSAETGVPFAALIPAGNPTSGAYGGMSFVVFPNEEGPALIALVVGTQGLNPDEQILGRPGHARRAQAIARLLNTEHRRQVSWAKHDPTRIDIEIPRSVVAQLPSHRSALQRYGSVIYLLVDPEGLDDVAVQDVCKLLLDLFLQERGVVPLKGHSDDAARLEARYQNLLMPEVGVDDLAALLGRRRFVIVEGPPGTGKTRAAGQLVAGPYGGNGTTIQFHPTTTYETFIGGLAPVTTSAELGMRFEPSMGALMLAAKAAAESDAPYLLHIDEINRADLAKVLGEAIYLMEPTEEKRAIALPYDFGPPLGREFRLPPNLHILGTMNSADRSTAILDVAIRRRFAFVKLWPQQHVVEALGNDLTLQAYSRLFGLFVDHANDESFDLMPGHSYFIAAADGTSQLATGLIPLLEEYLQQGYVAGFAEEVRAYIQWLKSELSQG